MPSLRTPYQVLNLSPDAEPVVIEAAYRALIKKYHPDLWLDDPNAQSRAASINKAFATLRDPDTKAACDREMRAWRNAVHTPPLQPVHPRPKGRELWWAGWAAAALVGLAQFLPWQDLTPQPGRSVSTASEPTGPTILAAEGSRVAGPTAAPVAVELPEATRRELGLPRLTPPPIETGADAAASQPDIRNYLPAPQARVAPSLRQRRATRPKTTPARSRRPAARQPAAEREFLEREGYIY